MLVDAKAVLDSAMSIGLGVAGNAIWALIQATFLPTPQAELVRAFEVDPKDASARKALENALRNVLGDNAAFAEELAILLLLAPWNARVRPIEGATDAQLLTPYRLFTQMIGREQEMNELLAWANSDKPVAIRLITGGAGAGKTRIAMEFMRALESSQGNRWHAGFLSEANIEHFSQLGPQGNTLAVVDYAATASGHLKKWFEHLADNPRSIGRLRILLVEREAQRDTGWWETLTSVARSQSRESLRERFDPEGPKALRPLGEADRRELFQAMLGKAAEHLRHDSVPRLPAPHEDATFDRQLALRQWGDPLYLMMAALAALMSEKLDVISVLSLNRADLAGKMAEHEIARLERFAATSGGTSEAVIGLAAQATLCRGIPANDRIKAAEAELESLGMEWPGGPGKLAKLLSDALPGQSRSIGFVEPDIVGEAFVVQALGKLSESEQKKAILRAVGRAQGAAIGSVIRIIQDLSADDVQRPMEWLTALIEASTADDAGILPAIEAAMPKQTVHLRERAVQVTQLLLSRLYPDQNDAADADHLADRACLLNNLAVRLSCIGRRDEALTKALEAEQTYKQLARSDPHAFMPGQAASLGTLANMLRGVGRRNEALDKMSEAVRANELLAQSNPDAFLPRLAMSLNNLAVQLMEIGRADAALETATRAARIYEQLVVSEPDSFLPELAMSLDNMALQLMHVDRREEALAKASEAARIYRGLVRSSPDSFLPSFAGCLSNLAKAMSGTDRNGEALEKAKECTRIYEQLAESSPDAFLPALAISLSNTAALLSATGESHDALARASEAVRIQKQLVLSNPDAFLAPLARSLGVQAYCLRGLERYMEATESSARALEAISKPLQETPTAFSGLAHGILKEHVQTARAAGVEPDMALVLPVFEILKSVYGTNEAGPTPP